jgi:hypothetical protein
MTGYHDRPDGEYAVDAPQAEIPHPSTWGDMNLNQLIDLTTALDQKLAMAGRNRALAAPLEAALARVDALRAAQLAPR